ncbi:MAG: hypothetical protein ACO3BO_01705 [Anaerohalosphaeraceae bacterium]
MMENCYPEVIDEREHGCRMGIDLRRYLDAVRAWQRKADNNDQDK